MSLTPEDITRETGKLREAYAAHARQLTERLGTVYRDPADAREQILSLAEEFGADHALEHLIREPERFGATRDRAPRSVFGDQREVLARELESLAETQDLLDDMMRQQEQVRPEKPRDGSRTVHIQGEPFRVDAQGRIMKDAADRPRHPRSLTERLSAEHKVPPAQPGPTLPRDRNRT